MIVSLEKYDSSSNIFLHDLRASLDAFNNILRRKKFKLSVFFEN